MKNNVEAISAHNSEQQEWLTSLVSSKDTGCVLDIGCADGLFLRWLSGQNNKLRAKFIGLSPGIGTHTDPVDARISYVSTKVIDKIDYPDKYFTLVHSNNVFECFTDPEKVVEEINRVLKPSGKIVISHYDWGTQLYNSDNVENTRKILNAYSDWEQNWMDASDGWMGRKLWGLLQATGDFTGQVLTHTFVETTYTEEDFGYHRIQDMKELVKTGAITDQEYQTFLTEQTKLAQTGKYFYSLTNFAYVGVSKSW